MTRWLIRLILSAVSLTVTSVILNTAFPHDLSHMQLPAHGNHTAQGFALAALAVLALSLVNSILRPILRFLSMPLTFMTMGLSGLIINAALFWAVGHFTGGYEVGGVVGLALGPILLGFFTGVLSWVVRDS